MSVGIIAGIMPRIVLFSQGLVGRSGNAAVCQAKPDHALRDKTLKAYAVRLCSSEW